MPLEIKIIVCQNEADAILVAAQQQAAGALGPCTLCKPPAPVLIRQLPVMQPQPVCGNVNYQYSVEVSAQAPDAWMVIVERNCR